MTKEQEIAAFLDSHLSWPRVTGRFGALDEEVPWMVPAYLQRPAERPSVEELAQQLLGIAEFRALQLGTWLGTTDGTVIAEAVELVVPSFYAADVELLVAALQEAASLQQQEGQRAAGQYAFAALLFAVAIVIIRSTNRSSA